MQKSLFSKTVCIVGLLCTLTSFAQKRAMTVEDLWNMKRIGEVALSPDGRTLAYTVSAYDMDKNSGNTDLWLIPATGGEPRQLTYEPRYDGAPRWKPDGSALTFISSRDGSRQIYQLPLTGGEATAMTHLPVDVQDFLWTPDGAHLVFTASVHADAKSLDESAGRSKERDSSKVKAHATEQLMYRVFDAWTDGLRSHVFVCNADGAAVIDLTPGPYDTPPLDLGGTRDFAVSPDGQEIAFVRNTDPITAVSTNNDIYLVSVSGGTPRCITPANLAVDNQPFYSPDGRWLAYKAMRRPGFEADRLEIMLYDRQTGTCSSLTAKVDLSIAECIWSPDSKFIYFTADNQGRKSLFKIDIHTQKLSEQIHDHSNASPTPSPDGNYLYFKQQSVQAPDDLYRLTLTDGSVQTLTQMNQPLLQQLEMHPAEDFWFSSFDGKKVHGLLIKPPGFDANRKYPLIYVIHGGPQGMSADSYHYRWNPSLFAAPGYIVAMVNFRGSSGYGQAWTDAVSKDWGGGPYKDLMAGIEYLVRSYTFIDPSRLSAAGGSYGGFMVNWMATHTDRFRALVSHAGVFDQRSMYGATEELWFPEWEFDGPPYTNPESYAKWSPSFYVNDLKKYQTPTLVIHGEGDYRVPYTQSMQMFTALQRMGVPSRLLIFPDETHFVLKPQNAKRWWQEVHGWIGRWAGGNN